MKFAFATTILKVQTLGISLYDEFDADVCGMLNSKLSMGVLVKDDAELGKDQCQVIRLAVILYVLYTYNYVKSIIPVLWNHILCCRKELHGICNPPYEGLI